MFILTDGKYYVMENPMRAGDYMRADSVVMAKEFSYKQARKLVTSPTKRDSWIRGFQILNKDTMKAASNTPTYHGNANVYIGENDVTLDESILESIDKEAESIMGLQGYDLYRLESYMNNLNIALSKYDSIQSDIVHAMQHYRESHNGRKAQAHKMAKIAYMLDDVRDKRKDLKRCMRYAQVMINAINDHSGIEKLKADLSKAATVPYRGRTEYYEKALKILEEGSAK